MPVLLAVLIERIECLRGLCYCMQGWSLMASPTLRLTACKLCSEFSLSPGFIHSWRDRKNEQMRDTLQLILASLVGALRGVAATAADDFLRLLPALKPSLLFINKATAQCEGNCSSQCPPPRTTYTRGSGKLEFGWRKMGSTNWKMSSAALNLCHQPKLPLTQYQRLPICLWLSNFTHCSPVKRIRSCRIWENSL